MHGRAHREAGCLFKTEEGRNTPPGKKGMGILSNEEEYSKSELSRDTHSWWSAGVPNERESSRDVT